jgi:SPP1 gp7 family putative phage head morphogenesis protein
VVVTPAATLQGAIDGLGARWEARINEAAPKLGRWFAHAAATRSQAGLKNILKDGGMTVEFHVTPTMRDAFDATVAQQVGLIKSIGSQYHSDVQGAVMRSVTAGRDVGGLTKELRERYGVTKRRAAFIALDQNNKSTSVFVKVRQVELGIQAIWLHSHAGKKPRPTHVANSGKIYDPAVGWLDPAVGKRIWPGTEPRCRCVSKSVVKGFS